MKKIQVIFALCSISYGICLNSGLLSAIYEEKITDSYMGIYTNQADEAHYFAMINTAANEHLLFGSASLKEWKDTRGNAIFGPVFQALILKFSHLSLSAIIWAGDLFFPTLSMFIFCNILYLIFRPWESICIAILIMNTISTGWLRTVNPQLTMMIIALYFFMLFVKDQKKLQILRGILIAIFCFLQIQIAIYLIVVEALLFCACMIRDPKQWKSIIKNTCLVASPVFIAVLTLWFLSYEANALALQDYHRRLGLINSHLPAAPKLQFSLLIALILSGIAMYTSKKERTLLEKVLIILLSGIIVLNQSVITGKDAIFGLYYANLLTIVFTFSVWVTIGLLSKKNMVFTMMLIITVCVSLVSFSRDVIAYNTEQSSTSDAYKKSGIINVIDYLAHEKEELIILAPFELSNLIPVYTTHSVAFNSYARFGMATDEDLVNRFLLYRALFPTNEPIINDLTYSVIFGQYAGNTAARKRLACKMRVFIDKNNDCNFPIRDEIYHQDLLPILDSQAGSDTIKLLSQYHIDRIIMKKELPTDLQNACEYLSNIQDWIIYRCN